MTLHINKPDYQCLNCKVYFFPFRASIVCPNCKTPATTTEYYDTIDDIARSMKAHKMEYGRFMPGAWLSSSYIEQIQSLCFKLFDDMEAMRPKDERHFLANRLSIYTREIKYVEVGDHHKLSIVTE